MIQADVLIAEREQQCRELFAAFERQRLVKGLLRQQRQTKRRTILVWAGWGFLRTWGSSKGTVALCTRRKEGVLDLPLYCPDSERDLNRKN